MNWLSRAVKRFLYWLESAARVVYRWHADESFDGVSQTASLWGADGTAWLDPEKAPPPPPVMPPPVPQPARLIDEIRSDIARQREERELRQMARRVDDETGGGQVIHGPPAAAPSPGEAGAAGGHGR